MKRAVHSDQTKNIITVVLSTIVTVFLWVSSASYAEEDGFDRYGQLLKKMESEGCYNPKADGTFYVFRTQGHCKEYLQTRPRMYEDAVIALKNDRSRLKRIFNECQVQIVQSSGVQQSKLKTLYPCQTAMGAAGSLWLASNWKKPLN